MDPENKQWFTPDKTMAPIFGEEKIKAFGMLNISRTTCLRCLSADPSNVSSISG